MSSTPRAPALPRRRTVGGGEDAALYGFNQLGRGRVLTRHAQLCPSGSDHHEERSDSNRGTLPPSWIECYEQSLCTHPWAEVLVQPFHPRNLFEVLGIRPLHTAPFKQVKLDEAQRKRKRLDSILLPHSIFTGWELLVGFACDKSLFCLLSRSSFLRGIEGCRSIFCFLLISGNVIPLGRGAELLSCL